jgi:hypothetical protein
MVFVALVYRYLVEMGGLYTDLVVTRLVALLNDVQHFEKVVRTVSWPHRETQRIEAASFCAACLKNHRLARSKPSLLPILRFLIDHFFLNFLLDGIRPVVVDIVKDLNNS